MPEDLFTAVSRIAEYYRNETKERQKIFEKLKKDYGIDAKIDDGRLYIETAGVKGYSPEYEGKDRIIWTEYLYKKDDTTKNVMLGVAEHDDVVGIRVVAYDTRSMKREDYMVGAGGVLEDYKVDTKTGKAVFKIKLNGRIAELPTE